MPQRERKKITKRVSWKTDIEITLQILFIYSCKKCILTLYEKLEEKVELIFFNLFSKPFKVYSFNKTSH